MTLADLKPGKRGQITTINTASPGIVRLMTLGLIEGCEVTQDRAAPGGDPLQLHVYDATLSIRREQAQAFSIEPQD